MPFALLLFYRVLGILLWVLVLLMLWEKYRIVRGGTLLPAQILDCCKSSQSDTPAQPSRRGALINPRVGAGGYCYRVVFTVLVWYNPASPVVERKSWETEVLAAAMGVLATALLLIR